MRFHCGSISKEEPIMKRLTIAGNVMLLFTGIAWTQEATTPAKKSVEPDQGVFGLT